MIVTVYVRNVTLQLFLKLSLDSTMFARHHRSAVIALTDNILRIES